MSHTSKPRLILGSLVGAFAIHIAALACSGNGGVVGGMPDAATADHDGGFVDAIVSAVDAAVHDVATKITDGEVRDAHAGGDPVRTMEAACTLHASPLFPQAYYAIFEIPGFNPETAGEVHVRVCGYSCDSDAGTCQSNFIPRAPPCVDGFPYSGPGYVVVGCGANGERWTTARIWLH